MRKEQCKAILGSNSVVETLRKMWWYYGITQDKHYSIKSMQTIINNIGMDKWLSRLCGGGDYFEHMVDAERAHRLGFMYISEREKSSFIGIFPEAFDMVYFRHLSNYDFNTTCHRITEEDVKYMLFIITDAILKNGRKPIFLTRKQIVSEGKNLLYVTSSTAKLNITKISYILKALEQSDILKCKRGYKVASTYSLGDNNPYSVGFKIESLQRKVKVANV